MTGFFRWVQSFFGTKEQPVTDAAVPLMSSTVKADPVEAPSSGKDVSTLRAEGKAKMSAKDYAAADELFLAALAIEPTNEDLKQLLITSRARANRAAKAV
jgi:thioredoxin-like negative regulator of GroEL